MPGIPIPASCAHRPTVGGLVAPFANLVLADGGVDFRSPHLCVACAQYASKACPMVAGQLPHYADRARLSEGRRGQTCPDPTCHCGGYTPADPDRPTDAAGEPAHPWYAVFIAPAAYKVTAHWTTIRCSDRGCEHQRLIVNGGQITTPPLKVVLVSTQDEGRVWRRLPADEWPIEICTFAGSAPARGRSSHVSASTH